MPLYPRLYTVDLRKLLKTMIPYLPCISDGDLQFGFQRRPSHGAFDQAVGIGLRSEHLGVLAGVLQSLVPVQI